ncbi:MULTISPECIES: secondary thiamine-phosphate synthase enzyme YjbQ [unclassified Roseibium]|uniref:secondary thiamine-phosphate synthase enzyme YjbQ n=1 Tax=unclassified Roseibium TaxID=2629323 RepID=UPI00273FC601|nr:MULTISPECIES: secondary thiamine-phosphate synthase enzyme YjbQ [unclassified Roseibium]
MQTLFSLKTSGQGLYEFTRSVSSWLMEDGAGDGLLTLFVRHTSCSLLIQENADPDVQVDLKAYFSRLVPPASDPSMRYLTHTLEGLDDMPAHIKAAVLPVSLSIPVSGSEMLLGTWQGIYLFEHRDMPHQRQVAAHFLSDR